MSGDALGCRFIREIKDVAFALVISPAMKMVDEIGYCAAERAFAEQDQLLQTFFFHRSDPRSGSGFARAIESV
jgi:hypothetical protein